MPIGKPSNPNRRLIIATLLVFILGVFVGWRGWVDTLLEEAAELPGRFQPTTSLPTLNLDIPFENWARLLAQREDALTHGALLLGESDFVTADIRLTDESGTALTPVRLRLQEGLADPFGDGQKWPFDVRTRDDQLLFGMRRFALQDPAGNNWVNQWGFVQSLQQEGLLTARYQFVNLNVNGDAWGIYAIQEGFTDELLLAQGHPAGVIIQFNADPLWESVRHYNGDSPAAFANPISNLSATDYAYFELDTFREARVARDELLAPQNDNAISLLRALQAGDLTASQIFAVDEYATFLALVELWGAHEAVSLLNLRYTYDDASGLLHPISYNGNPLATQNSYLSLDHTYNDPVLQSAYAQALWRVSQPDYLAQLEASLDGDLRQLQQALAVETDVALPWTALQARQTALQNALTLPQPVFAYLGPPELSQQAIIQVDVANITNLPVEIVGFQIGEDHFFELDPTWRQELPATPVLELDGRLVLPAGVTPLAQYTRFHLSLITIQAQAPQLDFLQEIDLRIVTRLWGLDETQMTPARAGYPEPIIP